MDLGLSEKGSLASLGTTWQGGWVNRGSKNRPVSIFCGFHFYL